LSIFDKLLRRRSHYRAIFQTPSGHAVLADLKRFCHWGKVPMVLGADRHTDIYATGVEAGRQEVFQRIVGHVHIDDAQLLKLKEENNDDD